MDFKLIFLKPIILSIFFSSTIYLTACGNSGKTNDKDAENIVGTPVNTLSESNKIDGMDKDLISSFDDTVRKIHLFDLKNFKYNNSFSVDKPEAKHYLITQDEGQYIIDLSEKNVTTHNTINVKNSKIFKFVGDPISTAYRSNLNLLVIYDSLFNVGIAKLDTNGTILDSNMFGYLLDNDLSLRSGDLLENGKLVLSLSDNSIAVVDTEKSLSTKKWNYTTFPSTLSKIVWLAPVSGKPNQIFVKSDNKISLLDIETKSIVSEVLVSDYSVEKYSKSYDAHILMRSNSTQELTLYYVKENQIKSRVLIKQDNFILSTHLNLGQDTWTFVDSALSNNSNYYYNDLDYIKINRTLLRYRLSDMAALSKVSIRNDVQMQLTQNYIFTLIPSELGNAVRITIDTGEPIAVTKFNMQHL